MAMKLKNDNPPFTLTVEQQRAGGKASVEARKKRRDLRYCLEQLMEKKMFKDSDGKPITGAEAMAIKALQQAVKGNDKFWALVRDTSGQKPIEKVAVAEVTSEEISEVENLVERAKKDLETHDKE